MSPIYSPPERVLSTSAGGRPCQGEGIQQHARYKVS